MHAMDAFEVKGNLVGMIHFFIALGQIFDNMTWWDFIYTIPARLNMECLANEML